MSRHILGPIALLTLIAAMPFLLLALGPGDEVPGADALSEEADAVTVALLRPNGDLTPPLAVEPVVKRESAWREQLGDRAFRVLREHGTERPNSSALLDNDRTGIYACAGCGLPLFHSRTKYDSGTGWPSFFRRIADDNIGRMRDNSLGMSRTEVHCKRCEGHLGHVFEDGPEPTGLRYCINGDALRFVAEDEYASAAEAETAVLAGGCFWCVEAVFEQLEGVHEAEAGYAGGDGPTSYERVVRGNTGHAEAVRVFYDPREVSYVQLLDVFFNTHDPTTLNRQGPDVGPQYRSAIFFADDAEKQRAHAFIDALEREDAFDDPIVTTLEPLDTFYPAESYHQDYAVRNPGSRYIQRVAVPKLEKLREQFPEKLKQVPQDESEASEDATSGG